MFQTSEPILYDLPATLHKWESLEVKRSGQSIGSMQIWEGCACRKSNPDILVVQSTQDRTAKNVSSALNGARCRRILVQR